MESPRFTNKVREVEHAVSNERIEGDRKEIIHA